MAQNQKNDLGTGKIGRLMLRFGVPSVVAMLVNALYNIVDQIFIGHGVGYLGNGAANVVLLMTMVTLAVSMLIGDGAAAYYSLNLGAGESEKAAKGIGTAMTSVGAASISLMAVGLLFLQPVLKLFGCTDVLMPYAVEYGRIIVLGLPFIMVSTAMNSLIRADGSPKFAMASMIFGVVINGLLDPLFIFGFGWGIKGAALSTWIGQGISFVISICYLKRFQFIVLKKEYFKVQLLRLGQICKLGISSFIDQLAFTMVMAVNNNLIVHYGAISAYGSEIPLTAYGVSMKVQEILFTVLLGIAVGMQPIVGYNFGAKNYRRVKRAYGLAILAGTVLSIGATVLFVGFPEQVIGMFGFEENPLYLEFAAKFFRTYFLCYVFFGFQTISGIFFQAIGKPAQAAAISLAYQLGFKIFTALVLSGLIGLDGVLWSGPVADILSVCLVFGLILYQIKELSRLETKHSGVRNDA